jgi:phosphomevalonate kinase
MVTTVVSAPGKVLLAGGYLVLDRKYTGLVVATSSRFYTVVRDLDIGHMRVRVRSPQFLNAEWDYQCCLSGTTASIQQLNGCVGVIDINEGNC